MAGIGEYEGWLIALALIGLYSVVVAYLYVSGRLGPNRPLSLFGPALMIKTQRGRGLLDRIGRFRRFWSAASAVGVALAGVAMLVVVGVLLLDAVLASQVPASAAPSPSEALALPGLNPIIPLGYGIVAIVVGIVLHELAHGIVARSQQIGVKSLGVLWLVVPIGAFVEQDDEEMTRAPRFRRRRVAAAGVLANFVLAVAFFVALAALVAGSVQANATGAGVAYVVAGSPAANASLAPGDIITAVNGSATPTNTALFDALANTTPGEVVPVSYFSASGGKLVDTTVTLASRGAFENGTTDDHRGFLGVATLFISPADLRGVLVFPPASRSGALVGGTEWIVLPLAGLEPVAGPTAHYFHLVGPLAGVDPGSFWIVANLLYWLAWMNLLLGLSNALPLVPLDGGLLFRDFVAGAANRLRPSWSADQLNRFSGGATAVASVTVVGLLIWQFVGPLL